MRRRSLMAKNPEKEWDVEWDASMGDPSLSGITFATTGTGSYLLTDSGIQLAVENGVGYVRLDVPQPDSFTSAVAEYDFTPITISDTVNGLRLILASRDQGGTGIHLFVNQGKLRWESGGTTESSYIFELALTEGQRVLVRSELHYGGASLLFLNDSLLFSSPNLSSFYASETRIFQQNTGSTMLHAVRIRYH